MRFLVALCTTLAIILAGCGGATTGTVAQSPSQRIATAPPTPRPVTPRPTVSADELVCESFESLWDIQTRHAIPVATRLSDWVSFATKTIDVKATYADARAIGEGSVKVGRKIESLNYREDPGLVVSLKQSVSGYAKGSVALKGWLDAGDFKSRASYDVLEALQELATGAEALGNANTSVAILNVSGGLPCDARY